MILMSDLLDKRFEFEDSTEGFVSLKDLSPRLVVDERACQAFGESEFSCYVRERVGHLLERAAGSLPPDYSLIIKAAFRPPITELRYFEIAYDVYRGAHQGMASEDIFRLLSAEVAPLALAGHPTGGAVDLTLGYRGEEVGGRGAFESARTGSGGRAFLSSPDPDCGGAANRRILAKAMCGAGFVNYPPEWWHWSYGDKYWAFISGRPVSYVLVLEDALRDGMVVASHVIG
jgi:D-alanyl-D-alanine dipeptidase